MTIHNWSHKDVDGIKGKLGLRKRLPMKEGNKRKQFTRKICPLCNRAVLRLNNHLRQVHKIAERKKMLGLLSIAKNADDPYEAQYLLTSLPDTLKGKYTCHSETRDTKESRIDAQNSNDVGDVDVNGDVDQNHVPKESHMKVLNTHEVDGNDEDYVPEEVVMEPASNDGSYDGARDGSEDLFSSDGESEDEQLPDAELESTKIGDFLRNFKVHLLGVDGGWRPERLAKQMVSQILVIHKKANGNSDDIAELTNVKNIRDKWMSKMMVERRPGTVMAYLSSLQAFYKYAITDQVFVKRISQETLIECVNRVNHWQKSNRKVLSRRKWEKRIEDGQKLAKADDFIQFDSSEPVRAAIKMIASFTASSKAVKKYEYTLVRDYIITSLCMDNASRTGAIANMRLEEVGRAEKSGDSMLITVLDHKTLETSGPAILALPVATFNYLDIFLNKMRSQIDIDNECEEFCFLSWNGKRMNSSNISEQLKNFWKNATGKPMNAALMRKSCVSQVHHTRPDMKVKVADHMCHSVKTAENYYCITEKKSASAGITIFLTYSSAYPLIHPNTNYMCYLTFSSGISFWSAKGKKLGQQDDCKSSGLK